MSPSGRPRLRSAAAGGLALAGFLLGRRAGEISSSGLIALGASAGTAALAGGCLELAVVAAAALAALRGAGFGPGALGLEPPATRTARLLGAGLAGGLAIGWVSLGAEAVLGLVRAGAALRPPLAGLAAGVAVYALIAVSEELVFRGVLYRLLGRAFGEPAGLFASAAAFSAVHWASLPGAPATEVVWHLSLFGFGLAAALALHRTGSLWLPIGLHWGWDLGVFAILLVFPVQFTGPPWLAGGKDHVSAGLVMLAVLVLAGAVVALLPRRPPGRR